MSSIYDLTIGGTYVYLGSGYAKFGTGALATNNGSGRGYAYLPLGTSPIPQLPPFTVDFWAYNNNGGATYVAVGQESVFWIGADSTGNAAAFLGTSTSLSSSTNVVGGTTHHHFRLVCDTNSTTLSINGAEVATGPAITSCSPNFSAGRFIVADIDPNPGGPYNWIAAGGGAVDEVAIFDIALPSIYTPPTKAYSGTEAGLVALYHFDGNASNSATPSDALTGVATSPAPSATGIATSALAYQTVSGAPTVPSPSASATSNQFIAPGDPSFLYSPGNWLVSPAAAQSIYAGAYIEQIFTGNTLQLNFDVSRNVGSMPEIIVDIDRQGPQVFSLASTVNVLLPSRTLGYLHHTYRLTIKATNYTADRWNEQQTGVTFIGSTLASGGMPLSAIPTQNSLLFLGDGVPEGINASYLSAASSMDQSDASLSFASLMRDLLGTEVGVSAFHGSGLTIGSAPGGVPPLGSTWNMLWANEPRNMSGYDLIAIYIGQYDVNATASTVQTTMQTLLQAMLVETSGGTQIAVIEPFSGACATALQNAVNAVGSSRVQFITTTGFLNPADTSDGIHPSGGISVGQIAPLIANQLRPLIEGNATLYQPSFGGGF